MAKKRMFATRTLKDVPLTFENENRERVTEKFTVVYRSFSHNANQDIKTLGDGNTPFCDLLSKLVVSIFDSDGEALTDDNGNLADLSNGFFDTMSIPEAEDLYNRIHEDIFPPKASPPHGPSGSPVAESGA